MIHTFDWPDWVEIGQPSDCWRWLGRHNREGYPIHSHRRVHRLVAALFATVTGPVHHRCENRWCVNPDHLQPTASHAEHRVLHRTGCRFGHGPLVTLPCGKRRCRVCHAEKMRRARAR